MADCSDRARQDEYRAIEREDNFRKSAGDLGTFGIKTLVSVAGGATALLIGFREPGTIVERIGHFILPFTATAVVVALVSVGFGYASLQAWANSISYRSRIGEPSSQKLSDQFERTAEIRSGMAFWLYLTSVVLLALAVLVGLIVLYCVP